MAHKNTPETRSWETKPSKSRENKLIPTDQAHRKETGQDTQVPIAERVKFWQEQDKINRSLIPRVLQTHEKVCELSKRMDKQPAQVSRLVYNYIKSDLSRGLKRYNVALRDLKTRCDALEQRIEQLESKSFNAEAIDNSSKKVLWQSGLAVGFAALALLVSVLNYLG